MDLIQDDNESEDFNDEYHGIPRSGTMGPQILAKLPSKISNSCMRNQPTSNSRVSPSLMKEAQRRMTPNKIFGKQKTNSKIDRGSANYQLHKQLLKSGLLGHFADEESMRTIRGYSIKDFVSAVRAAEKKRDVKAHE